VRQHRLHQILRALEKGDFPADAASNEAKFML
jgi:hypothetical protein